MEIGVEAEAVWKPMEGLEGNVLSLVEGEEREVDQASIHAFKFDLL